MINETICEDPTTVPVISYCLLHGDYLKKKAFCPCKTRISIQYKHTHTYTKCRSIVVISHYTINRMSFTATFFNTQTASTQRKASPLLLYYRFNRQKTQRDRKNDERPKQTTTQHKTIIITSKHTKKKAARKREKGRNVGMRIRTGCIKVAHCI